MNLNPPRKVRIWLYLIGSMFGPLLLQWITDEAWLDKPSRALIAGVLGLIGAIAVGNTIAQQKRKDDTP